MTRLRVIFLGLLLLLGGNATLVAQDRPERPGRGAPPAAAQQAASPGAGVLRLLPPDAVSDKQIVLASGPLAYTATAGTLALYDQSGEQSAAVFYTAYVAKDRPAGTRPLTFVFNGGPGAASAYLHFGLVGPRILPLGATGRDFASAKIADNKESWLAFTDLVMIDPVGTGWSRAAKPDGEAAFRGVRADADSIAKVIALYVGKNSRHASPKYLLGESYGGFRAAKVARALQREQSMTVTGIVMVSPMLEGGFQYGPGAYALGAALHLPSYVASELERRNAFSEAAVADAERYAMTDYLVTLAGKPLQGEPARAFYDRIARMTGLPLDVIESSRGFVGDATVKLRGSNGQRLASIYDGRVTSEDPFPESGERRVDPLLDGATRAYGSTMVAYARDELGFKTEMTYSLLAGGRWDWGDGAGRLGASASDDLRVLLSLDPSFRVLVVHGYTDLVTPYGVTRYVLDHMPIGGPDRVQLRVYRGGHMLYMDDVSRRALTDDAKAFYQRG